MNDPQPEGHMASHIGRRKFLATLLGGAVAMWPLAARAQKADRMRRIGVLNTFAAEDPEGQARIAALLQALQPLGWTVGTNLRIDHRWGTGDAATTRKNAAELVALAPDVILTSGAAGVGPPVEHQFKKGTSGNGARIFLATICCLSQRRAPPLSLCRPSMRYLRYAR